MCWLFFDTLLVDNHQLLIKSAELGWKETKFVFVFMSLYVMLLGIKQMALTSFGPSGALLFTEISVLPGVIIDCLPWY